MLTYQHFRVGTQTPRRETLKPSFFTNTQRLKDLDERNKKMDFEEKNTAFIFKTFFSRLQHLDEKRQKAMGCHGLLRGGLPWPAMAGLRGLRGGRVLSCIFFYFSYIHVSHGHFTLAFYILPGWPFKTNIAQNIYFRVVFFKQTLFDYRLFIIQMTYHI